MRMFAICPPDNGDCSCLSSAEVRPVPPLLLGVDRDRRGPGTQEVLKKYVDEGLHSDLHAHWYPSTVLSTCTVQLSARDPCWPVTWPLWASAALCVKWDNTAHRKD